MEVGTKKWVIAVRFLLLVVAMLLGGTLTGHASAAQPVDSTKVDSDLVAAIQNRPADIYRVIVEMTLPTPGDPSDDSELFAAGKKRASEALDHVKAVGGKAKNKLGILGGATAEMTGKQIADLSHDPRVQRISQDRILHASELPGATGPSIASLYTQIVRAPDVWRMGYTGRKIGIAIIDSGVYRSHDIGNRLVASVDLVSSSRIVSDPGGHGTHVAGIAAGNGVDSLTNPGGTYKGIAPFANIISVRVINEAGHTTASAIVAGIQWAIQNRNTYNIRVINLSLGGVSPGSYTSDPIVTATEFAWKAGIVVVCAAGNEGPTSGIVHTPGIDPYSITVGAVDDNGTLDPADDTVPFFSSRGPTFDGVKKPDLLAPGRKVISLLSPNASLPRLLPDRIVPMPGGRAYFRLTGTSQATAVVSGVVALMLEHRPDLKPDQVKYILKHTAHPLAGVDSNAQGAGVVDALSAVTSQESTCDNQHVRPTDAFAAGAYPLLRGKMPLNWKDSSYLGRGWSKFTWKNLTWDNDTWDNLMWDNLMWDNLMWDNLMWDNLVWNNLMWDTIDIDSAPAWDGFIDLD